MQNNAVPEGFVVQAIMYPYHGALDTHVLPHGGTGMGLGPLQDKTNSCVTPVAAAGLPLVFRNTGVQTASQLKACTAAKTAKGTGSHTGLTKMVKSVLEGSDKTRWAGLHKKAAKNMYWQGDKPTVAAFLNEMVVGHDEIEGIMKQYSTQKGAKKWAVIANQCALLSSSA